jgi:DNA primase
MDQISQIKQALNIVDVIASYMELTKAGKNYKGVCPFHAEKTPSFMVSPDLQMFKCFGCAKAGDAISFVKEIEGIEFAQALQQLADKAGIKLEKTNIDPKGKEKALIYEINALTTRFYSILLNHPSGKDGLDYLKNKRGLTDETIKAFNIGFAPHTWSTLYQFLTKKGYNDEQLDMAGVVIKRRQGDGYIDKFRGRIMFPLTGIDEKVIGFTGRTVFDEEPKYLNSPETLVFYKNSFIYGLNKAKIAIKKDGAVFVEGQMDVISAHQAGIENVIAASGTSLTTNQLKILSRYTQDLTFCFDADTAGQAAVLRAIELAEKENFNIKVAILPAGYKDLDEIITKDKNLAKKVVNEAVPIYDFFLATALKENEKKTAIGKRKIIEYMATRLAKIKSKIVLDHYLKKLAEETDTKEESLLNFIDHAQAGKLTETLEKEISAPLLQKQHIQSTETYILSLLFNSELELAQNILYKLGKTDFTNDQNKQIFIDFKDYVIGRKRKFDIKYFIDKLNDSLKAKAEEIYLKDIGNLPEDGEKFEKELNTAFNRLKKDKIARELKDLKEKLKQAEMENNLEDIESLSQKVIKFGRLKKQYE